MSYREWRTPMANLVFVGLAAASVAGLAFSVAAGVYRESEQNQSLETFKQQGYELANLKTARVQITELKKDGKVYETRQECKPWFGGCTQSAPVLKP